MCRLRRAAAPYKVRALPPPGPHHPPFDSAERERLVQRQQAAHPLRLGEHLGLRLGWLWLELGSGDLSGIALAAAALALAAAAIAIAAAAVTALAAATPDHIHGQG